MTLSLSTLVPLLLATLLLFIALRILLKGGMLAAIVRAVAGLALIGASVLLFLAGYDLLSYRALLQEQTVVTLQFQRLAPQNYRVVLVESDGEQHRYQLSGDQWQLDARMLKWHPSLASVGFKSLYRLERLSGRYADIRQQLQAPQSAHQLGEVPTEFDTWLILKRFPGLRTWIDAQYGTATFLPMANGAIYEVKLAYGGLIARPVNLEAKAAVSDWQ
ncbi:cation/multidrug efflux pump [Porticoccus sp.]